MKYQNDRNQKGKRSKRKTSEYASMCEYCVKFIKFKINMNYFSILKSYQENILNYVCKTYLIFKYIKVSYNI